MTTLNPTGATVHKLGAALAERARRKVAGQADVEDVIGSDPRNEAAIGGIAVERLKSIVDRIEEAEAEKARIADDIKDIYTEAKSAGFDVKVLRQIIRLRKQEPAEVEEQEDLLALYKRSLGM